jgi:hypothetical protein
METSMLTTTFRLLIGRPLDFDSSMVLIAALDPSGGPSQVPIEVTAEGGTLVYIDDDTFAGTPGAEQRAIVAELPSGHIAIEVSANGRSCLPISGVDASGKVPLLPRLPSLLQVVCE